MERCPPAENPTVPIYPVRIDIEQRCLLPDNLNCSLNILYHVGMLMTTKECSRMKDKREYTLHSVLKHKSSNAMRIEPLGHIGALHFIVMPRITTSRQYDNGHSVKKVFLRQKWSQRDRFVGHVCRVPNNHWQPFSLKGCPDSGECCYYAQQQ